jgi:exonuclease SbcC
VGPLPEGKQVAYDKVKTALEKAHADEKTANERASAVQTRLAVAERDARSLDSQLTELAESRARLQSELAAAIPEPGLTAGVVEKRIASFEKAKTQRSSLEDKQRALVAERQSEEKRITGARTDVLRLDIEAKTHESEAARAGKDAAASTAVLREAALAMSWEDVAVALDAGRNVAQLLRGKQEEAQSEETRVNQQIGAAGKQIEQIAADIEKAKALRDQEKTCREEATLARDLASLLRTDSFPTFLRQRAMKVLATAGSEQLRQISGGRYDLIADGQDFAVEDLWNASTPRPVRTLSGGETFLASLALALALAQHLPALAGSGHQSALESLFIDEGFSHLDAETLDIVANALEVLGQDRNRLIGVVTHVPALAERMPARITVHKSQAGSTVTVD